MNDKIHKLAERFKKAHRDEPGREWDDHDEMYREHSQQQYDAGIVVSKGFFLKLKRLFDLVKNSPGLPIRQDDLSSLTSELEEILNGLDGTDTIKLL